jgi:hypothetical protein
MVVIWFLWILIVAFGLRINYVVSPRRDKPKEGRK